MTRNCHILPFLGVCTLTQNCPVSIEIQFLGPPKLIVSEGSNLKIWSISWGLRENFSPLASISWFLLPLLTLKRAQETITPSLFRNLFLRSPILLPGKKLFKTFCPLLCLSEKGTTSPRSVDLNNQKFLNFFHFWMRNYKFLRGISVLNS